MSESLGAMLFQSETRSSVLELLFVGGLSASVSELARRATLSPRSVAREVSHLLKTGLVTVETVGGSDVVRANTAHPGARHVKALLLTPGAAIPSETKELQTRESLVAWGAPLFGVSPSRHFSLEESLLRGLVEARHNGTILRVLPTVLAHNLSSIDWNTLREDARRRKLKAELGWLIELTAELLDRPELKAAAAPLHDKRRRAHRFFPEVKGRRESEVAKLRAPELAQRWGFWMNMSTDTFRSTLEKHHA